MDPWQVVPGPSTSTMATVPFMPSPTMYPGTGSTICHVMRQTGLLLSSTSTAQWALKNSDCPALNVRVAVSPLWTCVKEKVSASSVFPVRVNQNYRGRLGGIVVSAVFHVSSPESTLMDFFSVIFTATVSLVAQPKRLLGRADHV